MLKLTNFRWIKPFRTIFGLKDLEVEPWVMTQVISPTIVLNELPSPNHEQFNNVDLSGVNGTFVELYQVPQDCRVRITHLYRGTTTGNTLFAISPDGGTTKYSITTSSTAAVSIMTDIVLVKGWSIGAVANGNAGDNAAANRQFSIMMEIETRSRDRGSSTYYSGDYDGGAF